MAIWGFLEMPVCGFETAIDEKGTLFVLQHSRPAADGFLPGRETHVFFRRAHLVDAEADGTRGNSDSGWQWRDPAGIQVGSP